MNFYNMKLLPIIGMTAVILASCAKEVAEPLTSNNHEVQLTVSVSSPATKATVEDTADESSVQTLQVLVFKGGAIDAYGTINNATSLTLSSTVGSKTICALVNAPDLSSITTLSALNATVSTFASDNTRSKFLMVGTKNATLASSSTVTMEVNRIAARVKIDKITRSLAPSGLAAMPASSFKIVRYYLTNVVGNRKYDFSAASPMVWLSSSLASSPAIATTNALVYDKPSTAPTLAQGASNTTSHSLYCYPNSITSDSSSGRITRLVVECQIDGSYYTYPIPLGAIDYNHSYEIKELIITKLGNKSDGDNDIDAGEDDIIQPSSATFNITVKDWEQVYITTTGESEGVIRI